MRNKGIDKSELNDHELVNDRNQVQVMKRIAQCTLVEKKKKKIERKKRIAYNCVNKMNERRAFLS